MFKAERFSAADWARLFKEAGAKFVVPVAEHHDGFPMYDCSLTEWSAAKMGPKRDIVGELSRAVPAEGLVFGLSSHRAEHWWFFDGGMEFDSDVKDPRYAAFYGPARSQKKAEDKSEPPTKEYMDDWLARTAELVDKYHPQLVWFDWWIEQPAFAPYLQRFAAFYYNRGAQWQKGVAINYKNASFPAKAAVFDVERGQLPGIRPEFWQTDTSISKNSWGYVAKQDYKTAGAIVGDLVDIVSKNGALLLNIGPRPDGTIPEPEQEILREIGRWLKVNGEAIYGTRPWAVYGEGPTEVVGGSFNDTKRQAFTGQDIRFTTKPGALYAIALAWPGKTFTVKALAHRRRAREGARERRAPAGTRGRPDLHAGRGGAPRHAAGEGPRRARVRVPHRRRLVATTAGPESGRPGLGAELLVGALLSVSARLDVVQRVRAAQAGPAEAVEGHEGEAAEGHDEGARHAVQVADVPHDLRQQRPAHDRHHDERGRLLGAHPEPVDAQREDRREHDRHEEVAQEDAGHREPAELQGHQQAQGGVDDAVEAQDLVGRELPEDRRAR